MTTTLKVVEPVKGYIEANLGDLFSASEQDDVRLRFDEVRKAFSGKLLGAPNDRFRVPAADNGNEIFFRSRELMSRFVSMCKPDQEAFLTAVRDILRKHKMELLFVELPWSNDSRNVRTVSITAICGPDGHLDMYFKDPKEHEIAD